MLTQAPKGTHDIYGAEARVWQRVENTLRALAGIFLYKEIRTPIFEHTELFLRGVGETSDVVQKEMYSFTDKGGRGISLRPEMTAGAARAYVEHGMHVNPQPQRFYYIGPNFRYENPQAGRYRQHVQFGVEIFGVYGAAAEAEIIALGHTLLTRLGVEGVSLHINSIGCAECRSVYHQRLKDFLGAHYLDLCETCRKRFEKNPLRALDCKTENCKRLLKDAPSIIDSLDDACLKHFNELRAILAAYKIPFTADPKVVRGLDYYTRTVFEFIDAGGQTVIGGGRYDNLIEEVGGAPTGAAGFGMGLDRLAALIQDRENESDATDIFIGSIGEQGVGKALIMTYSLRLSGVMAECDMLNRSVKAQMKYADKIGARFSLIIGDDEIANGEAVLRDMLTGGKTNVALNNPDALIKIIGKPRTAAE